MSIVTIDHEEGDFSDYTTTVTDGGRLIVAVAAALAGTSYGLAIPIDLDTDAIYGEKSISGLAAGVIRCRFYFDPNSTTTPGEYSDIPAFEINSSAGRIGAVISRVTSSATRTVRATIVNDAGAASQTGLITMTDAPHYVEFKITRATNSTSNDGQVDIWVDGAGLQSVTGIDNYDRFSDLSTLRAGALADQGGDGRNGTLYLDEIVVNDTGDEIGPIVPSTARPVFMANYRRRRQ